jgi:maleylpyruvate isomerase
VSEDNRTPELEKTLPWLAAGTAFVAATVEKLSDDDLREPSILPGWSRAHVVAHLARNAEALTRLANWARTGVETPMYTSLEARGADIEASAVLPADFLRADLAATAAVLDEAIAALDETAWKATVRHAKGTPMGAMAIPWLRNRELWFHVVDLGADATFADLPDDLVDTLLDDAATALSAKDGCPAALLKPADRDRSWRLGATEGATTVDDPAADTLAWLAGRKHDDRLPEVPGWL